MDGSFLERRPIEVLPPGVSQRIAAGEIVERPVSVLRELVDNAIDAGARTIWVEVRQAGLEEIMVADDGQGIAATELRLAFVRHATSKLRTTDDLDAIATLGFRGEALPSIASVSTVEVVTATEEGAAGRRLLLQAGEVAEEGFMARTRGTTIRVRDLFGDQPVRRGFLPGPRAEHAMMLSVMRRYALCRPALRFSLTLDGRSVFRAAGLGRDGALATVFGAQFRRLQPLQSLSAAGATIEGVLGDPGLTRGDRDGLIIIVNGRWVTPARWFAALEEAYQPLLHRGRHPVAVLWVTIDPARANVNLHPAKLDVRLADEELILRALGSAIRERLGHTPAASRLLADSSLEQPRQQQLALPRRTLRDPQHGYGESMPDIATLRLLGQSLNTLLVAQDDAAIYLIDQHRAAERAIYEKLARGREGAAQELIEPLSIELHPDRTRQVERLLPELTELGFRFERFGRRTFLIRAVPSDVSGSIGDALRASLDEEPILDGGGDWKERLLISVSCRAALKRGVLLADADQRQILARLAACSVQTMCPHGSPIIARLTPGDLARHFEWS